jgi:hypothetical protein
LVRVRNKVCELVLFLQQQQKADLEECVDIEKQLLFKIASSPAPKELVEGLKLFIQQKDFEIEKLRRELELQRKTFLAKIEQLEATNQRLQLEVSELKVRLGTDTAHLSGR